MGEKTSFVMLIRHR